MSNPQDPESPPKDNRAFIKSFFSFIFEKVKEEIINAKEDEATQAHEEAPQAHEEKH